jgi:phosphatidylcholine synthase
MRAVGVGAWEEVFAWLALALIIDGIDGALARLADVSSRLPRISGERLDLIVDYVTYVFVPTLALLQAGYLRAPSGIVLGALILLSALFHFSDTASKDQDHCFVGFPAVWNIVAFYVFALRMSPDLAAVLILLCVALTFVPLRWAHPLRTRRLFWVTLGVLLLWSLAAALTLLHGFPAEAYLQLVLCLTAAYGVTLALLPARGRPKRAVLTEAPFPASHPANDPASDPADDGSDPAVDPPEGLKPPKRWPARRSRR